MSTKSITMRPFLLGAVLALCIGQSAQSAAVLTTYQNQQAFVDMRFGMFVHFNLGHLYRSGMGNAQPEPIVVRSHGRKLRPVGRCREVRGHDIRRADHQAPRRLLPLAHPTPKEKHVRDLPERHVQRIQAGRRETVCRRL